MFSHQKHSWLVPYFVSNLLSLKNSSLLQYAKNGKKDLKGQVGINDLN